MSVNYNYQGKNIVIIGLGLTGISCIYFFRVRHKVTPRVMDTRISPPGLKKLPTEVEYWLGGLNEQWLQKATLIVVSPGIALSSHSALIAAAAAGIEIISDIELFVREAMAPIVAITGSNGKSTVTQLVGNMAKCAGLQVQVGGNIGVPVLQLLYQPCQLYVIELSSFQLERTYSLTAAAATVLNISEDHTNRYPGIQQYRAAKLSIYQQATVCVVNAEDMMTVPVHRTNASSSYVSFGVATGDYRLEHRFGKTWLTVGGELLLNSAEIKLRGRHNYTNALAALALANAVAIPRHACLTALRQFNGLAHRFELVHTSSNGVSWINDSKATNVDSTKAALKQLNVVGKLHLLLGGDGKCANFKPLLPLVQGHKVQLYCFGQDRDRLAALRPDTAILTETLEQAMMIIGSKVIAGDLVLLSPACASSDQFTNCEARGDAFTQLARKYGA